MQHTTKTADPVNPNLFGAGLSITFFSLAAQAVTFLTQVVIAAAFGANSRMDAFIAASALPQYVIAVLVGSLGFVFVPLFVDAVSQSRESDAWRMASSLVNLCGVVLSVIAVLGMFFAEPLLRLTTPGLPEPTLQLAARLAQIIWPSIVASGLVSLLSGLYQVTGRFSWPAAVPFIGALANLLLLPLAIHGFGIRGVAGAFVVSLYFQAALLVRVLIKDGRYTPSVEWRQRFMRRAWTLLYPLLIVSLLSRCTPVLDRYFASSFPEGSISHLSYAFRVVSYLALIVSGGFAPVLFPKMARSVSEDDMMGLRRTLSSSLAFMWILIAPVILIGAVVAKPVVMAVFVRGQFTGTDAVAVSALLQIYLIGLIGTCMGNLTGRCFYALQDTRTPAIVGTIQTIVYALYAAQLSRHLGAPGLVWAYVIYFNVSLLWQLLVLGWKIGGLEGTKMAASMAKTAVAALIGAAAAWLSLRLSSSASVQLFVGLAAGLAIYIGILSVVNRREVKTIVTTMSQTFRGRSLRSAQPAQPGVAEV